MSQHKFQYFVTVHPQKRRRLAFNSHQSEVICCLSLTFTVSLRLIHVDGWLCLNRAASADNLKLRCPVITWPKYFRLILIKLKILSPIFHLNSKLPTWNRDQWGANRGQHLGWSQGEKGQDQGVRGVGLGVLGISGDGIRD